ncbi:trichothecene 3-o-acetyltransferase [Ophiostoma piceae UAMH 11346]|uniref:Trichothecene 3-o-acetyltransferase n=1 Tax=Ophiostoma piceae (strain UAMH 11346) TaxID=1262450 RepID=S3C493_OPHP1|nr:trichothecene 3-o-acetyltransferase [Ophiostoma piceae UAMH 11346]
MESSDILVRATGWEQSPEKERFPLSPIAQTMPKIYVLMAEVFPLAPDGSPSPGTIVKNMTAGLQHTLSQFPALAATLEMDAESGRMWAAKNRDSGVHLHVKYMAKDEFPTYMDLNERDFPAALLDGNKLLPTSVTAKQLHSPDGNNDAEGIPLVVLQLNFIQGGLVLGIAVHHVLSDGPGCDGFLTTWAENTISVTQGLPFQPMGYVLDHSSPPFHVDPPSPSRFNDIKDAYPVLKDAGGPMAAPPPGFQMPTLVPQMWHFPKTRLTKLKSKASGTTPQGANADGWISTYDAIMALLWSRITAAKVPLLQPDINTASTTLVHAVNTRGVWADPALPDRFIGSAAVQARSGPLLIRDVIATPQTLPATASTVRSSIRQLTLPYLLGMLEWITGHKDQRYLETDVNSFLGLDLGGSSWQGITAYERHDFGFGLPHAVRWPSPPFEGFVFLYPSRASFKEEGADEGIEVCVCLEESCHKRLLVDEVLAQYAHPRG